MTRVLCTIAALLACMLPAPRAAAESLDWHVEEEPQGTAQTWLREMRDGFVGLTDCATDLQTGVFAEVALTAGQLLMAASDIVGIVDDNLTTQHVFKATFSKALSRTAYLLHVSGSEAILGSHGLEAEWYLQTEMSELNPLLHDTDTGPLLPMDPLEFMRDALIHPSVYTSRIPGRVLAGSLIADLALRPVASLARIAFMSEPADRLDARSRSVIRWAVD